MTKQITKVYQIGGTVGTNGVDFASQADYKAFFKGRDLVGLDENYTVLFRSSVVWDYDMALGSSDDYHRVLNKVAVGYGANDYSTGPFNYPNSGSGLGVKVQFNQQSSTAAIVSGYDFTGFRVYFAPVGDLPHIYIGHNNSSSIDVYFRDCRILDQSQSTHDTLSCGIAYGRLGMDDCLIVVDSVPNKLFLQDQIGCRFRRNTYVAINASAGGTTQFVNSSYGGTNTDDCLFLNGGSAVVYNVTASNCFANTPGNYGPNIKINTTSGALVVNEISDYRPTANGPLIGAGSAAGDRLYDIVGNYRGEVPDVGAWQTNVQPIPAVSDATITSVSVRGQTVSGTITYTSIATGGTVTLNAASSANGAQTVSGDVILGSAGNATFQVRGVIPGNYASVVVGMKNGTGVGASTGGNAFTVAVPSPTQVKITSVIRFGGQVVINGKATNSPVSGQVSLVASPTVPNGAVTQGPIAIKSFDAAGNFSVVIGAPPTGTYSSSTASATNFSGNSTDTGPGCVTAPQGQIPVGSSAVNLPAFVAPAFNSPTIAIGQTATTVSLFNGASAAVTNVPFTVGQVFKKGAFAPGNFLVGKVSGQSDIPLQVNVRATHPDGSVRHAVVSGIAASIPASSSLSVAFVRSTSTTTTLTPVASSAVTAGGFTGSVDFTDLDGTGNTAHVDIAAWLNSTVPAQNITTPGSIMTEWIGKAPVTLSTGSAAKDLDLYFHVRYYPTVNATRIDVIFERTRYFNGGLNDSTYSARVTLNGTQVYSTPSGYYQPPASRNRRKLWTNNANPLIVCHNPDQLIDSMQVANYDRRVVIDSGTISGYQYNMDPTKSDMFTENMSGTFDASMGGTGGRPEIGLLPGFAAAAVLSANPYAIKYTLMHGDRGGPWPIHFRDNTAGAPGYGLPMSLLNYPYISVLGHDGDANNPETGVNEHSPAISTAVALYPEESHTPNIAYLPYLLTGDWFFLEEMQFWTAWTVSHDNPYYREFYKGLVKTSQERGQGWMMRSLFENAAITPDNHYLKTHFNYLVGSNLGWYNGNFTDNPNANQLHINDTNLVYFNGLGCSGWQDDHFTSSIGHGAELGFDEATRLLKWKAKFQVGRMIDPGFCFNQAAGFAMKVRDTSDGPLYTTLAQCMQAYANEANLDGWNATLTPEILAMPCNSPQRAAAGYYHVGEVVGYAFGTEGYPSNYQPALAMAVDSGGYEQYATNAVAESDDAWSLFDMRTVKPPYNTSPQFAIVPRTISLEEVLTPPQAPQNVTGAAVTGGIQLSAGFPPQSTGGYPLKGYIGRLSTGQSFYSTTLPLTVPAPAGTTATATLSAINTKDVEGVPSDAVGPYTVPGGGTVSTVTGVVVSPKTGVGGGTYTATVNGTNSPLQTVTWSVDIGSVAVSPSTGAALYSPPTATNQVQVARLTATSVQDRNFSDFATITIAALPAVPTVTDITVRPASASMQGGGTLQFTSTVNGNNSPSQDVTWTSNAGQISSAGYFLAPAATNAVQSINVTATSVQDARKSTTVVVTVAALPVVPTVTSVTVTPSMATVNGGESIQLLATVVGQNSPSTNVTWTLTGPGSLSVTGRYTAPGATDNIQLAVATATSVTDTSVSALCSLLIPKVTSGGGVGGSLSGFVPSDARTVYVKSTLPDFVAGKFWDTSVSNKPRGAKDPDATIDITFDWTDWLSDMGSPSIDNVVFTLNGVTNAGSSANRYRATVFVAGGTSGATASVACKITTDSTPPRVDERTIYLDLGDL